MSKIALVYRLILVAFLSLVLPVGRLFEIFSWKNQIVKTGTVHSVSQANSNAKHISYSSVIHYKQKRFFTRQREKQNFIYREYCLWNYSSQLMHLFTRTYNEYKKSLLTSLIFNTAMKYSPELP